MSDVFSKAVNDYANGVVREGTFAPDASPERAAKALDFGARSGKLPAVIDLNIEVAAKAVEQQERASVVSGSPALQNYIASDSMAAKVSSDDFDNLDSLAREIEGGVFGFQPMVAQPERSDPTGVENVFTEFLDAFGAEVPGLTPGGPSEKFFQDIGLIRTGQRIEPGAWLTEPFIRAGASFLDLTARGFYATGAALGQTAEEALKFANDSVGERNFFGNPNQARREVWNFFNFMLLRSGIEGPLPPAGTRPALPLTPRVYEFLKKADEFRPRPKTPIWQMVDPKQKRLEFQALRTEFEVSNLDAAMKAVVESKTRERSPEMFQRFAEQQVGDRTIAISGESLKRLYDEQGVAPAPGDPILGFVPDVAAQLQRALATGGDVEVPLANYLAHVKPEVHEALLPSVRSSVGMTIEEVTLTQKEIEEALAAKDTAKKPEEVPVTIDNIIDLPDFMPHELNDNIIASVLTNTGFSPKYIETDGVIDTVKIEDALNKFRSGEWAIPEVSENTIPHWTDKELVSGRQILLAAIYKRKPVKEGTVLRFPGRQAVKEKTGIDLATIAPTIPESRAFLATDPISLVETHVNDLGAGEFSRTYNIEINGESAAILHIIEPEGFASKAIKIEWFGEGVSAADVTKPNQFGPAIIRKILGLLQEKYPNLITVYGDRFTGARKDLKLDTFEIHVSIAARAETARKSLYLDPLFTEPAAAGMGKAEFELYSKGIEKVRENARSKDLKLLERQTARELTEEWRTTLREEVAKAEREFDDRLDIRTETFIQTGSLEPGVVTDDFKLDKSAVESYGVTLSKSLTSAKGINPDELASVLGYASGEALVRALSALEASRGRKTATGYREQTVKAQAQVAAQERFGDPEARIQAVIDAITDPDITKVLFDDLRVMRMQNEGIASAPLNLQELQRLAFENFGDITIKQAKNIKSFIQGVMRTGRKAYMASLRGKVPEAFKAKNEQLLANLWLQQAVGFSKSLSKGTKLIRQFTRKTSPRSIDPEFTIQIQRILVGMGFPVKADKVAMRDATPLAFFVAEQQQLGYDLSVSNNLYDQMFYTGGGNRKFTDLTVREFEEFIKSIESLKHVGQDILKVTRAGEKQALADAIDSINASVETLAFRQRREGGLRENLKTLTYRFDSYLVKMEEVFDDLDLQNAEGPFNQIVFIPLTKAEYLENSLFQETRDRIGTLRIKNAGQQISNTEFLNSMSGSLEKRNPFRFTRGDLVMMALNFGNAHNRRLLVDTLLPPSKFTETDRLETGEAFFEIEQAGREQQVLDYINRHMTEADWKFVDGLWEYFRWLKPQIDGVYRRTAGVAPDTVEPLAFETPFGTKQGGYTPVISNPMLSSVSVIKEARAFEIGYHKATTPNSWTKPRHPGSQEPLLVQGQYTFLQHRIRGMLHDIAFREPIINARKILYNKKVRELVTRHYGQEYVDLFHPWLRYVANHFNEEDRTLKWITQPMRQIRQNLSIAVLGLNPKTIGSPNIGPLLLELGYSPADVAFMMEPKRWAHIEEFALANFDELRARKQNQDHEINRVLHDIVGMSNAYDRARAQGAEFGMALVALIDRKLATITAIGTYDRAIEAGKGHEQAVILANKAIRKGFGSASVINLAAIYRGSEFLKPLVLFTQYYNMIYNRERDIVQIGAHGVRLLKKGDRAGAKRDFIKMLAHSIAWLWVPAFFGLLYVPQLLTDEEDNWGDTLWKLLALQLAGPIPMARDITARLIQGVPASDTPMVKVVLSLLGTIEDAAALVTGDDPSEKWIKHAANTAGYLLGQPLGSIGSSAQYLWNVNLGDDEMETLGDFLRGMIYGTTEPGK